MKLYAESGTAARRYQKKYRNQLWHSDYPYFYVIPTFRFEM
jgi:putative transposase